MWHDCKSAERGYLKSTVWTVVIIIQLKVMFQVNPSLVAHWTNDLDIRCQHERTVKSTFVSQDVFPKGTAPLWSHFMQLSLSLSLSVLTLSPHLTPSSPHFLSPPPPPSSSVPTERCHHPLPSQACLHPCHFFRWPGKSRPTGGVHGQPQPLTAAPATAC